jgi:hypothetical protein
MSLCQCGAIIIRSDGIDALIGKAAFLFATSSLQRRQATAACKTIRP